MLAWHFTDGDRLRDGRPVPPIGETLKYEGPLELCKSGLHASVRLINALWYSPGLMLHRVECAGELLKGCDKLVCSKRTILASADMRWALVEFAENCAKRAAAHAQGLDRYGYTNKSVDAAYYAYHAAADAVRYANAAPSADPDAVRARATAAALAASNASRAADAAAAAAADATHCTSPIRAAAYYDAEREHQNSTLELWFECLK